MKSWFFLHGYSIISFYSTTRSSPTNLVQVSNQPEREKITTRLHVLWMEQQLTQSPSFARVLINFYARRYLINVIGLTISFLMFLVESILIFNLVEYLQDNQAESSEGALLAALLILNSIITIILFINSNEDALLIANEVKKSVTDIVSDKLLRVHRSVISKENVRGKFLNVITADLTSFEGLASITRCISSTVTFLACFAIVIIYFGIWGIIGLTISLVQVPIILHALKYTQGYRTEKSKISDGRLKLIENLIENIKVIKLYAWEMPYLKLIFEKRKLETRFERKIVNIISTFLILCHAGLGLVTFVSLTLFVTFDNDLDTAEVFFLMSVFFFTQCYAIQAAILGIEAFYSIRVVCNRIEELLLLKEFKKVSSVEPTPIIHLENCKFSWGEEFQGKNSEDSSPLARSKEFELSNIRFQVNDRGLIIVVGPSGSGKTTLLMGLLGELISKHDIFEVSARIGYVSEEPWIIPDTFRENVVMGKEFNPELYAYALESCALDHDIASLPNSDNSLIGDRGITLSGGQKARLSLARALYSQADIYLLDDPLSAVDTEIGLHLFRTIKKLSTEKIVVIVTHQVHFIPQADKVLVISNGSQLFFGTPNELNSESVALENVVLSASKKTAVVESEAEDQNKRTYCLDKRINESEVTAMTYWKYIKLGASSVALIFVVLIIMVLGVVAFYAIQYWCVLWLDSGDSYSKYYIIGFAIIVAITYVAYSLRVCTFNHLIVNSNEKLHNNALEGLTKTDPKYFDSNPAGILVTRFSKDMGYLNDSMVKCFYDSVSTVFIILVATIIQIIILPYTALVIPLWIILCYCLFTYVNPVVMQMRNTELVTRGPLISTYNSMLTGYATIRSLLLSQHFMKIVQEQSLSCFRAGYAFQLVSNCMQCYLVMTILLMFTVDIIAVTACKDDIGSSLAAFSLSLSLLYLKFTRLFGKVLIELHSNMCSAQRLLYFSELDGEGKYSVNPEFKITQGAIIFSKVCMRYRSDCSLALNNLSFSMEGGIKVGIVGRTGAGKSSILQVLFRLVNPESGSVLIDGVDHMTLGLHDLRKQISVIPQSSFLFNSSIRDNLDPFRQYSNDEVLDALDQVSLNLFIEDQDDLDRLVVGRDLNFSSGQRQLMCLARAILRKNKIVMMDEATSNIDNTTDKLIQQIVRSKFNECTMMIIAHRLRTVASCDKIIVMENGACKEFGTPRELYAKEDTLFRNLVANTGTEESQILVELINLSN